MSLVLGGGILALALTPQWRLPLGDIPHADKGLHILAFAAFILPSALLAPRVMWRTLPAGLFLGAGIEILQPLAGRTGSVLDFLADVAGLALGASAGLVLRWAIPGVRRPTWGTRGPEGRDRSGP